MPSATSSVAGITKLGASGGAAKHNDVFGTAKTTIASRLSTAEGDISNLKDAVAGGVHFRGTVTTEPGTSMTTVNGVTIAAGDVVIYKGKEYICTAVTDSGPSWEQLGDVTRIGNLETKINNLDVTTTNEVATTHEFVSQVTQADGKVAVTYTQPAATDVSFNDATNDTVAKKIAAMDAEIAGKALSGHTHSAYVNQNAFSNIKVSKSGGGSSDVTIAADTATDTVTDSPVQEPDDDFTLACIVAVVAVSPLLNRFKGGLTQTTLVDPPASVSHVLVDTSPPMFSVPEYEAVTDELTFT